MVRTSKNKGGAWLVALAFISVVPALANASTKSSHVPHKANGPSLGAKSCERELNDLGNTKKEEDKLLLQADNLLLQLAPSSAHATTVKDSDVAKAEKRWTLAYIDNRVFHAANDRQIYAWQLDASWTILGLVVAVVAAGIYFSWRQLEYALQCARAIAETNARLVEAEQRQTTANQMMTSSLKVSASGLQVTSSVVGIIVLTLSLAFLYLFTVKVYPITP